MSDSEISISKKNIWLSIKESKSSDEQVTNIKNALRFETMGFGLSPNDPSLLIKLATKIGLPSTADEATVFNSVIEMVKNGYNPILRRTVDGTLDVIFVKTKPKHLRIMLVETYALTSFFGNYGVGKTVRTLTLLPGEKTKISVKTWKSSETTSKQASSVLDSWSKDSSNSLERGIQSENTNRDSTQEANSWYVDAEVKAHVSSGIWGAEATVKGGAKGSTNTSRENASKNVSNATSKQVENAAAKRNVEVNTSFEAKTTSGEEQTIERQLENVNSGRVLNFAFRQLNQEYITYLHMIDVRLAFTDGEPAVLEIRGPNFIIISPNPDHYREFTLSQIEEFLNYCIREKNQNENVNPKDEVRRIIVEELSNIFDYNGNRHELIENVDISTGNSSLALDYLDENKRLDGSRLKSYIRIRKKPFYQNDNPDIPLFEKHRIEGIILTKNTYVLPTDSIIVEALLGQAEALDKYSIDSRNTIIEEKRAQLQKIILGNTIIDTKDTEKAELFSKIYPPSKLIKKEDLL